MADQEPPAIQLDEKQQEAVELFCDAPVGLITGGPGVGKTTVLRSGLAAERQRAVEAKRSLPLTALAAPTGKAACRMRDATGQSAMTMHRLLGLGFGNEPAPKSLECDHVVVDEFSMVDTMLMTALVRAVDSRRTRLTLVGDANQLPSVGPGQVLLDMLECGRIPTVKLETLHRAAQESWICRNAPRVLAGQLKDIDLVAPDFRFVKAPAGKLLDVLVDVYEEELNNMQPLLGYDPSQDDLLDQSQLIVPQRVGSVGSDEINKKLQEAIQGKGAVKAGGWQAGDNNFLDGDKIIQTKNDYIVNAMNGETGIVRGSVENGKKLLVRVDSDEKHLDRSQSTTWTLGYGITIHRSQGSQWPLVIVVCHSAHQRMLSRRLFYTAITRASKRVVLVGDDAGFERAVTNEQNLSRRTNLGKLLAV